MVESGVWEKFHIRNTLVGVSKFLVSQYAFFLLTFQYPFFVNLIFFIRIIIINKLALLHNLYEKCFIG